MFTIPVMNLKGGTGKTTITRLLAPVLAQHFSTLVIDLDPHAGLTDSFSHHEALPLTSYDVLQGADLLDARVAIDEGILHKHRLDLVGSTAELANADREVSPGASFRLRRAIKALPAREYDIVLIDATPALGTLFSTALMAASAIVVVTEPNDLGFTPTLKFVETVQGLEGDTDWRLPLAGIVLNRVRGTKENATYGARLREVLGSDVVFGTEVRDRTAIQRAAKAQGGGVRDQYVDVVFDELAAELAERLAKLSANNKLGGK